MVCTQCFPSDQLTPSSLHRHLAHNLVTTISLLLTTYHQDGRSGRVSTSSEWPLCNTTKHQTWFNSITHPLTAELYVLNVNWGPIHSLLWGPAWVTISTCESHLSSDSESSCLDSRLEGVGKQSGTTMSGFVGDRGGCSSLECGGRRSIHWAFGWTSSSMAVSSHIFSLGIPEQARMLVFTASSD